MATSLSYIDRFKNNAREWAQSVVELVNTPVTGELAKEKAILLKYANYIKKGVESIFGTIDELQNIGLGIAPLIPLAVIGASLAAIYKWNRDYAALKIKIKEQKRLEARGVDPLTASKIIASKRPPSFTLGLTKPVTLALVLGGGWWLYNRRNT